MSRWPLLLFLWCGLSIRVAADPLSPPAADEDAMNESQTDEPLEDSGIIPRSSGLAVSTQTLTPIAAFQPKAPYDQALDELEQAKALWAKGEAEAASDVGLQAYDDLCTIHGGRGKRNRKKRAKLSAERYQAASVYLDASLAYIRSYIKDKPMAPPLLQEARARMEDLRDVARDYPDLNNKLTHAIKQLLNGK